MKYGEPSYVMGFTATMEMIEADQELLADLFRPRASTFQIVLPDGTIREFDGIPADGTMGVNVTVTSEVREGSIYDAEGAD